MNQLKCSGLRLGPVKRECQIGNLPFSDCCCHSKGAITCFLRLTWRDTVAPSEQQKCKSTIAKGHKNKGDGHTNPRCTRARNDDPLSQTLSTQPICSCVLGMSKDTPYLLVYCCTANPRRTALCNLALLCKFQHC